MSVTFRGPSPVPMTLQVNGQQVHVLIEPRRTRAYLIRSLELLRSKHEPGPSRKHGNIPL